ncbi:MAG: hypothetical protein M3O15_03045, partial [Acidobacteriota bacterium]|nr:hypothetical protein [Acidobacteriota bacterium]
MDENRPAYPTYKLHAPGSASGALRLPGRETLPGVDDHLVEAEITRDEIVGGRRVEALPALAPHADRHYELGYVLRAHLADGYLGST